MSNPYRDNPDESARNKPMTFHQINLMKYRGATAAVYGIGAAVAVAVGMPIFFPIFFGTVAMFNAFGADPEEDKRLAEQARREKFRL